MVSVRNPTPKLPEEAVKGMQAVLDALYNARDAEEQDISAPFHDLLPRRQWADYYKIIKHPQALNPVQNKVKRKTYTTFTDFVRDCTQIFHNARLYNRHDSEIYKDSETLTEILKSELSKLAEAGTVTKADAELPDLGPLPPPSPTVSQAPTVDEVSAAEDEDEDEDDDDDDEDDDMDDDDEEGKKRRTRGRGRTSTSSRAGARKKSDAIKDEDNEEEGGTKMRKDDPRRRRGRPPRVDTPMETRIKNILKALRRLKDDNGTQHILPFDKLPEKKEFPEYYQQIQNPMAVDNVRKNVKRRVYKTVEQFLGDMELMFDNAKAFNEEDSDIYRSAVLLQEELRKSAEIEKAKSDEELTGATEEGQSKATRIPLDKIEHKGETYRVGDWIHIVNPNDPNKPTVAQIFRTWKDTNDQIWINACWYYRPEQTVHWSEKKFYEHEVVKTGQYRDHHIDEVLGKCYVMFFTRYSRGRPKGIDEKKVPVYVCESRYNEQEKHFNKIKTWKSCIPDEVRSGDYEMDMFDKQQVLKKLPSPILHLLPEDAKEGDPLPEAKMGVDNAPPIIGAVFKRARRESDSPPPEPTPPPQPAPPPPSAPVLTHHTPKPQQQTPRVNPDYHETMSMTQMYKQAHAAAAVATPTPAHHHTPQIPQSASAPSRSALPANLHPQHAQYRAPPPQQPVHYPPQQQPGMLHPQGLHPSQTSAYQAQQQHLRQQQLVAQQHHQQQQIAAQQAAAHHQYHPPAPPTTFTLPESVTHMIPEDVAKQFLRDESGQLLWFTVPPMATTVGGKDKAGGGISHSVTYLAKKKELEQRRKRRLEEIEKEKDEAKRRKQVEALHERQEAKRVLVKALGMMKTQLEACVVTPMETVVAEKEDVVMEG